MTVIKLDHKKGFWSAVPNRAADDRRLSAQALGLLVYCLCKPPDWQVRSEAVRSRFGWGKDAFQSAARELRERGYFRYQTIRDASGCYCNQITVDPAPDEPVPDYPALVHPAAAQPVSVYPAAKKETNKKIIKDNNNPAAHAAEENVVVVDPKLIESGFLSEREASDLKVAALNLASPQNSAQKMIDEVCGQIRSKGRVGPRGIKHPIRLCKTIANSACLDFASAELELREARVINAKRMEPIALPTATVLPSRPPPAWALLVRSLSTTSLSTTASKKEEAKCQKI